MFQSVILTGMSLTSGFDRDWTIFGVSGVSGMVEYGMVQTGFGLDVAKTTDVSAEAIVVHDAQVDNPAYAFALSRLSEQNLEHTVMGVDQSW